MFNVLCRPRSALRKSPVHPMPVNIPPRLGVLKKAPFCAYRPTLPDELIERAQTVDGITPITAGRLGCTDEIAKPPEEVRKFRSERNISTVE